MKLTIAGVKKGRTRHLIDSNKYSKVSRSKALCGKLGKELVVYDATFFNYKLIFPNKCKKCYELVKQRIK